MAYVPEPLAPRGLKREINLGATPVETAVGTPSDAGSNPAASTKLEAREAIMIWLLFY